MKTYADTSNKARVFHVRDAEIDDVAAVADLVRELAIYERKPVERVALTTEVIERDAFGDDPKFAIKLCERTSDGTICGYALYFYTYAASYGYRVLFMEDLYIKPQLRRSGAGRLLIEALIETARQSGCGRVDWAVFDWNADAIAFYERTGGVRRGDLVSYRLTLTG